MKIWEVWYSCYEDTGSFGYYSKPELAQQRLEEVRALEGRNNGYGDIIQRMGFTVIEIDADIDLPVF